MNETALVSGRACATIMWDIEKFFDSISPAEVLQQGQSLGYPSHSLALGLAMHMAPRVLMLRQVSSNAMLPTNSILAGCMQSCDFAKMVMKRPIQRIIREVPKSGFRISTFVDDVAQSAFGSAAQVSRSSAIAAVSFCASMKSLKLRVSDKTVIVASVRKSLLG